MPQIGSLTDFTANTRIVSSQVDANFSEIKTKVNTYGAWLDAASQTFSGNNTFDPASGVAITVTDGGITVTAGGITITAGGLTVTAGGATIGGNSTITGTLGVSGLLTASAALTVTTGNLTMSAGQAIGKRVDGGNSGAAKTIDFDTGQIHRLKLTANCTLTLNNMRTGATYYLELMQDTTGSRTITMPASVVWGSAGAPTLTTTASRKDIIGLFYNGVKAVGFVVEFGINDGDTA